MLIDFVHFIGYWDSRGSYFFKLHFVEDLLMIFRAIQLPVLIPFLITILMFIVTASRLSLLQCLWDRMNTRGAFHSVQSGARYTSSSQMETFIVSLSGFINVRLLGHLKIKLH